MNSANKMTIKDIARLAETSKTTVSFYLNGKTDKMSVGTKERIESVIAKTGYCPSAAARSLNAKNVKLIGVIIGDIANGFSNQLVKGIDQECSRRGYQIIVGNSSYSFDKETAYVERMLHMGVDGFIVQPGTNFNEAEKKISASGKEFVFIDSQNKNGGCLVKTNNYEVVYNTTAYCIEKGYQDYIMFTADPTLLSTRMERASGYEDALKEEGFVCDTQIIDQNTPVSVIQEYLMGHIRLDRRLLIFVPNCWILPKVFSALKPYRNLIPANIGLLGFDNVEWTVLSCPAITTIVQPAYEEGREAASLLMARIEGDRRREAQITLPSRVQWEEST